MRKLSPAELKEALDWLKDCDWRDMEPKDFDELTPEQIERAIARHFSGGIVAFKRCLAPEAA